MPAGPSAKGDRPFSFLSVWKTKAGSGKQKSRQHQELLSPRESGIVNSKGIGFL